MKFSRIRRRFLRIGCGLLAALLLLYFLRWPLLEGRVRTELKRIAADLFQADAEVGDLSGNLISSLAADRVVLKPGPHSWFREWTIEHLEVSYGLFGLSALDVKIRGARLLLAPGEGSSQPIHQVAPDVV